MPKKHYKKHTHARRYRRHRKHHIRGPLVSTKLYNKIICKEVYDVSTGSLVSAGPFDAAVAMYW